MACASCSVRGVCAPADVGSMDNKPAPNRAAKAACFTSSSCTWTDVLGATLEARADAGGGVHWYRELSFGAAPCNGRRTCLRSVTIDKTHCEHKEPGYANITRGHRL